MRTGKSDVYFLLVYGVEEQKINKKRIQDKTEAQEYWVLGEDTQVKDKTRSTKKRNIQKKKELRN